MRLMRWWHKENNALVALLCAEYAECYCTVGSAESETFKGAVPALHSCGIILKSPPRSLLRCADQQQFDERPNQFDLLIPRHQLPHIL